MMQFQRKTNLGLSCLLIICSTGVVTSNQYWTDWTTDGADSIHCTADSGDMVDGVECEGSFCDNIRLRCRETGFSRQSFAWGDWFSEEGLNGWLCGGFMSGIDCDDDFCDNIRMKCENLQAAKQQCCYETEGTFSDEQGLFEAPEDFFITGIYCHGDFCDKKRYRLCKANPTDELEVKGEWEFVKAIGGTNAQQIIKYKESTTITDTSTSGVVESVTQSLGTTIKELNVGFEYGTQMQQQFSHAVSLTEELEHDYISGPGVVWQYVFHVTSICGAYEVRTQSMTTTRNNDENPCCTPGNSQDPEKPHGECLPSNEKCYCSQEICDGTPTSTICNPSNPCENCQADCDSNNDCKDSLVCFHRANDNDPLPPGCTGSLSGFGSLDFCADPSLLWTFCSPSNPCGKCQGDCDNDADCKGNLVCHHRDSIGDPAPPGCGDITFADADYCGDPIDNDAPTPIKTITPAPTKRPSHVAPTLDLFYGGKDYCTPSNPCRRCQGDCDNDTDCMGNLVCHQRFNDADPPPPGCSGTTWDDADSCVDPNLFYGGPDYCTPDNQCGKCQGDCDEDADCKGNLVCHLRDAGDVGPSGCDGIPDNMKKNDYCV